MRSKVFVLSLLLLSFSSLHAADVLDISNEAELDAAIIGAGPGDTLGLDASFTITSAKDIPAGVTLDGNGFTINSSGTLLNQVSADALVRDASLISSVYNSWRIAVYGSIRFENCYINARTIAWANGQIALVDCVVEVVIVVPMPTLNLDFTEPVGVHGNATDPAVLSATNCVFHLGWTGTGPATTGKHQALGLLHNFGGNPSTLEINGCTIIGATDWYYDSQNLHMSVFRNESSVGPTYNTTVTNSVFIADASSIFRSSGTGTVTSRYNNNAGMARNPAVLKGTLPGAPNFYAYRGDDPPVSDKTGDIEETNPFVDVLNGDYRLVASSDSATGAEGDGPMGADLGVVEVEQNAYNLNFDLYDTVDFLLPLHTEDLFYGWRIYREDDDQFFYRTTSGFTGTGMRFEAQDTAEETGGGAHNTTIYQSAYQTFVVIPGYRYSIQAYSRRNASTGSYTWVGNGQYGISAIGVSDGVQTDPTNSDTIVYINGPEDSWEPGGLEFFALSNHITVHLIHGTNGSWNIGDWDMVTISGTAGSEPSSVDVFELYE